MDGWLEGMNRNLGDKVQKIMEAEEKWGTALKLFLLTFLSFAFRGSGCFIVSPLDRKPCVYFEGTYIAKHSFSGPRALVWAQFQGNVAEAQLTHQTNSFSEAEILNLCLHYIPLRQLEQHFSMERHLNEIQFIQNPAAQLLTRTHSREHIAPVLQNLHQHSVPQQIHFKLFFFTNKTPN